MSKKLVLSAVAAAALSAVAAPAMASGAYGIDHRLARAEQDVAWGLRSGQLNRREASRLQAEVREIRQLKLRFMRSGRGLDRREIATLEARVNRLEARLRHEMRNVRWGPHGHGPARRW